MNYNIIVQLLVHQLVLKKQAVTNIFFAKDIPSVRGSHKKKKKYRLPLLLSFSSNFVRVNVLLVYP